MKSVVLFAPVVNLLFAAHFPARAWVALELCPGRTASL